MKNIFLLPTKNPSELYTSVGGLGYTPGYTVQNPGFNDNQFIYITTDSELVLGGYHFNSKYGDEPQKTNQRDINSRKYWEEEDYVLANIVLSNDPLLNNDGIQVVKQEFLEWLVENPTREFVEVESEIKFFDKNNLCISAITLDGEYEKVIYYTNFLKEPKEEKSSEEKSYSLSEISTLFVGEDDNYGYFSEFLDYRLNLNGDNPAESKPTFKLWFEEIKMKK